MEKITKKYSELNEIQQLKISKVFMYQKIDKTKKKECTIVFEDNKMKYLFVDELIITI
jgi:hypothetical protein